MIELGRDLHGPPLSAGIERTAASDSRLVEGAQEGDPSAFDEIITRHYQGIFRLAYHRLRDREDASDVSQEVFLRACVRLSRLRRRDSLVPWLYSIAANLCVSRVRERRRDADGLERLQAEASVVTDETSWADVDFAGQVRGAVDCLPPQYRLAVVAYYWYGCSYAEGAGMLGLSVSTLRNRLHRGRAALRRMLRDAAHGREERRR